MSKTLICELPDQRVVEVPAPPETPYLPQTDEPEVPEPEPLIDVRGSPALNVPVATTVTHAH
jgi:hypothetical protein